MNKLVNVLIVKSVLDTILVATIAVVVYLNAFPPTFHGWGEAVVQEKRIAGWAVNDADPGRRVGVVLFIDGKFVGSQSAELFRPDVAKAGWAKDEWHGYSFVLSDLNAGIHEARVYAVHSRGDGAPHTLQLLGDPIKFDVSEDGTWKTPHAKAQRRKEEFEIFSLRLCAFA